MVEEDVGRLLFDPELDSGSEGVMGPAGVVVNVMV